ncbi:MAG: YiaA/YiaB family inner membrane protein [Myxococcota bacterium]
MRISPGRHRENIRRGDSTATQGVDMDRYEIDANTAAWNAQVWISFVVSAAMTLGGIALLPVDIWMRGYLLMGVLFTMGSSFSLSKTTRDNAETKRLRNRIKAAKTEKVLKEFEMSEAA